MTLHLHLGHRAAPDRQGDVESAPTGGRVYAVQRVGAVAVGLVLLTFGLLGVTRGLPLLSTHGERLLGLSANGALAVLSVVVAAILIGAAFRGPRTASTVMVVLGSLFLLSALVNLFAIGTSANVLAFETSNVVFSVVVGLVLLLLGAYGRFSGNLPETSPYAHPHPGLDEPSEQATTPADVAAERDMREAEIAVVEHRATADQRRRVEAMAPERTRAERRRVWRTHDAPSRPGSGPGDG